MKARRLEPIKFMMLLFLDQDVDETAFNSDTFLTAPKISLRDHYIPMSRIPLKEMMFYKSPVQLAEEVIAMTAGVNWRRQGRRPMRRGDIICRGDDPWVVLKRDEITVPTVENAVIPLQMWPNYGIHFLASVQDELKGLKL